MFVLFAVFCFGALCKGENVESAIPAPSRGKKQKVESGKNTKTSRGKKGSSRGIRTVRVGDKKVRVGEKKARVGEKKARVREKLRPEISKTEEASNSDVFFIKKFPIWMILDVCVQGVSFGGSKPCNLQGCELL